MLAVSTQTGLSVWLKKALSNRKGMKYRYGVFQETCLVRVRSALRLHRDLGVNLAGIALALDLMEELENLRSQLKIMRHD